VLLGLGILGILVWANPRNEKTEPPQHALLKSTTLSESATKTQKKAEQDESTIKPSADEPSPAPKKAQAEEQRMKAAVKQEVETRKQERKNRLDKLSLREQNEIQPLENEVIKVQNQIAILDKNLAKLRAQQQSLPRPFGIPTGTKLQPAIPRDIGMV